MAVMGEAVVEPEGSGISRPLSRSVNLLGHLLGEVIREQAGGGMLELVEELRLLCKRAAVEGNEVLRAQAEERIRSLDEREIEWLLRAFGSFFHLVNQAEKVEILRINRERSGRETGGRPRPESIDEAVERLKGKGCGAEDVARLLGRLDIEPTLTAHPTEARRRSILDKQKRIAELVGDLGRPDATLEEIDFAADALHAQIALLLGTDEVRAHRPTVYEEVQQGVYFLQRAIWETAARIYRDTERALLRHFGEVPEIPAFLRWRSWIGGDRDGNPNVTPEVTRWTLARQRRAALELHYGELVELRRELSVSDRQVAVPEQLRRSLQEDHRRRTAGGERRFVHEPYRRKVTEIMARLDALIERGGRGEASDPEDVYDAHSYVSDLELIRSSLEESGLAGVAQRGRLARALVLARTFGFHLAALDIREHSDVHGAAVAELLGKGGVVEDYGSLAEADRLEVLDRELRNPRPLVGLGAELSESTVKVLESFRVMADARGRDPESVGSYIVSMTHTVSDLLEPLLLAKETGSWSLRGGGVDTAMDVVPLFETIEDLEAADGLLAAAFDHPIYRLHLEGRGRFQEIMLGYSDSNKDGGYWMANWALHQAQARLGRLCRERDVGFRLFHGRGGTVGRGGGRANLAIGAMPSVVHNGRIRITEQGEVISFRYALPGIAHRHTEQLVSAMLLATQRGEAGGQTDGHEVRDADLMDRIAKASMDAYRQLIEDPELWSWYIRSAPVEQISRLPIASRPVSRKGADEVDFEGLRAIPWVFAWTQTRYIVPGWFGVGGALSPLVADDHVRDRLSKLYDEWPFFRAVVDNAQREMGRARLDIARHYAGLAGDNGGPGGCHARIAADFEQARDAILGITRQEALLDNNPVIQKSIQLRNPYTDVLNLLQIELLGRYREAPEENRETLRQLLFLSINGIAGAMQTTG